MKVTPLELKKSDFKRGFRGFDPAEVQSFLASAAETLEDLVKENLELKNQLGLLRERVKNYENLEKTLNETLIMAQKASESTRQASEREAELIIARAEVQSDRLLEDARARLHELKNEISALEREKAAFLVKMRSLVASQWKLLQEERFEETGLEAAEYARQDTESAASADTEPAGKETASRSAELLETAAAAEAESPRTPANLSEQLGRIFKSETRPLPGEKDELQEEDLETAEPAPEGGEDDLFWSEEEKPEKPGHEKKPDVFWAGDEPEGEKSSGAKDKK